MVQTILWQSHGKAAHKATPHSRASGDIFKLLYNSKNESRIIIKDMTGRTVMIIVLPGGENTKTAISLEKFAAGIYTYTQIVNGIVINAGKLIKE